MTEAVMKTRDYSTRHGKRSLNYPLGSGGKSTRGCRNLQPLQSEYFRFAES